MVIYNQKPVQGYGNASIYVNEDGSLPSGSLIQKRSGSEDGVSETFYYEQKRTGALSNKGVQNLLLAMLAADSRILKDPEPVVWVAALADSSVNLTIRAWVKNSDYWNVFFEHNEEFYKELPKHGLSFPFPQMDVHVKKE